MGDADALIAGALIAQGIDLIRLEASYNRAVLRVLADMEREVVGKLTGRRPLTAYSRERLLNLLAEVRSTIAQAYVQIRQEVDLPGVAIVQSSAVSGAIQDTIGAKFDVGTPSVATLRSMVSDILIQGAPSADWWRRQAGDVQFRFAGAVRQGIAQGETNAQIVSRVTSGFQDQPPIIETAKRNAEALVRTSVQTVANATRDEVFRANDDLLMGKRQISTLDGRTTDICIAYSGAEWDLDGKPINETKLPFNGGPPRHWGCRSILTPIVRPLPGLPEFKPATRASVDGPVRADITFAEWLGGKSKRFQDDLLGPGRAEMWRADKITLQQLLDQRGRPLTLDQLRERYAR